MARAGVCMWAIAVGLVAFLVGFPVAAELGNHPHKWISGAFGFLAALVCALPTGWYVSRRMRMASPRVRAAVAIAGAMALLGALFLMTMCGC